MNEKPHIVHASLIALIIISVYIPAITITAEFVPSLKNWLAATYGHHWVGKGIIMIMVYIAVFGATYAISKIRNIEFSSRLIMMSALFSIVSSLAITLFFVYEYAIH